MATFTNRLFLLILVEKFEKYTLPAIKVMRHTLDWKFSIRTIFYFLCALSILFLLIYVLFFWLEAVIESR